MRDSEVRDSMVVTKSPYDQVMSTAYGSFEQSQTNVESGIRGSTASDQILKRPLTAFLRAVNKNGTIDSRTSDLKSTKFGPTLNLVSGSVKASMSGNQSLGYSQIGKIRLGKRQTTRQDIQASMEANESMREINDFESRVAKIPNKYPKISLDKHLKLDSVMKQRINSCMQKHQEQQKQVLESYNPNLLSKSFKNVANLMA